MVVKIWTSRKLLLKNFIYWICTRFDLYIASPPSWYLESDVVESKISLKGNLWCKYECFLTSGFQNMDFKKILTQNSYLYWSNRYVLDFDPYWAPTPPPGMNPGVRCRGMEAFMVQVWMLSDKRLSKYGLLENFNAKIGEYYSMGHLSSSAVVPMPEWECPKFCSRKTQQRVFRCQHWNYDTKLFEISPLSRVFFFKHKACWYINIYHKNIIVLPQ